MKNTIFFLMTAVMIFFISSCVPSRKFEDMKLRAEAAEKTRLELLEKMKGAETNLERQIDEVTKMKSDLKTLKHDTTVTGSSLRKMTSQYDKINSLNDQLIDKIKQLESNNKAESVKLVTELELTREQLQKKEDELRGLETNLNTKEEKLGNLNKALELREKRVKELESILAEQKAASEALKEKISDALLGFRDKGLKVELKDGKIYVSMEAKLLFPSGSTTIDPEGKKALVDLAKVLKDQADISIMVEGHTDTDKIMGGSMKDNWDLSVLRATSVVRILTQEGVDQTRVTPAGRGEFIPLDPGKSKEAKAKNRRIEVVITPDLGSVFELLED